MGFTRDVAITDDADLRDYAVFEPSLRRGLSDMDDDGGTYPKTSFDTQHASASNACMDKILTKGYDPTTITNVSSFKVACLYWVLMHYFLGRVEVGKDSAYVKYIEYKKLWDEFWENCLIEVSELPSGTDDAPAISNIDDHSRFDGFANLSSDEVPSYEDADYEQEGS